MRYDTSKAVWKPCRTNLSFLLYLHTNHEAVRDSYTRLLESIGGKINKTRDDVKNMIKQISISFVGPIPGVDTSNIPLNLKQKNYPKVQYWKRDSWADLRRGASVTDSNSPIYSIFLEDEFGKLILSAVQDSIRDNTLSFWNSMHDAGNTPQNFSHTSLKVKDKFRSTLEGKHP